MRRPSNKTFIKNLKKDPRFKAEYAALGPEFDLLEKMHKAHSIAGLTQSQVARKMHTTTSVLF